MQRISLCHELGHANGWRGDHRGGSYIARPTLIKADLKATDILSSEVVSAALAAKRSQSFLLKYDAVSREKLVDQPAPIRHAETRRAPDAPLFDIDRLDVPRFEMPRFESLISSNAFEVEETQTTASLALFDLGDALAGKIAAQSRGVAGPVVQLMKLRPIPVDRLEIGLLRPDLDESGADA